MRQLTPKEIAAFEKAEKRRRMAAIIRFRLSANQGAEHFIDDLLSGLTSLPARTSSRLKPELVARKARILMTLRGLRPLDDFFVFAQKQLLDSIAEEEE